MRAMQIKNTIKHWKLISKDIHEPLNITDYNKLSATLDYFLDMTAGNEKHELIGLIDVISHMIDMYDKRRNDDTNKGSALDALKFLMEQHQLTQSDLPEIGSQGVVSEILHGKRSLNINQIKKLSERFHISPETFID